MLVHQRVPYLPCCLFRALSGTRPETLNSCPSLEYDSGMRVWLKILQKKQKWVHHVYHHSSLKYPFWVIPCYPLFLAQIHAQLWNPNSSLVFSQAWRTESLRLSWKINEDPVKHHWITIASPLNHQKNAPLPPQFDVNSLRSSTVGGTSSVLGGAWRARRKAGGLERENGGLLRAIFGSTHAERFASYNQETFMWFHTAVAQTAWPTNFDGSSSSPPGEHIPVLLFVVSNNQTPSMKLVRHGKTW